MASCSRVSHRRGPSFGPGPPSSATKQLRVLSQISLGRALFRPVRSRPPGCNLKVIPERPHAGAVSGAVSAREQLEECFGMAMAARVPNYWGGSMQVSTKRTSCGRVVCSFELADRRLVRTSTCVGLRIHMDLNLEPNPDLSSENNCTGT